MLVACVERLSGKIKIVFFFFSTIQKKVKFIKCSLMRGREREKERERCCVCMNDHRNSKAVALIPSETMMLPAPC